MGVIDSLEIKVSDVCNLQCKHCCMGHSLHGHKANFNAIASTIDASKKVTKVCFTGGEPLITDENAQNILSIMDRFKDRHIQWMITTNLCYELTPLKTEVLRRIDDLWTSFDINIRFGNIHNLLLWVRNAKYVNKHIHPNARLNCCISKYLVEKDPAKIQKFFADIGFKEYTFVQMFYVGSAQDNIEELLVTKNEVHAWFEKVLELKDIDHNKLFDCITDNSTIKCRYLSETTPVDLDGTIVNCICDEEKYGNCRISSTCLLCDNFKDCGGRCPYIPCIYFDKNQYKKAREYAAEKYRKDNNIK